MPETLNAAPAAHEDEYQALVDMVAEDQKTGISPEDKKAYEDLINYHRDAPETTQIEVKDANTEAESVAVHQSVGSRALSADRPAWLETQMLFKTNWDKDENGHYVKNGMRLDDEDMAASSGSWKSHEQNK